MLRRLPSLHAGGYSVPNSRGLHGSTTTRTLIHGFGFGTYVKNGKHMQAGLAGLIGTLRQTVGYVSHKCTFVQTL